MKLLVDFVEDKITVGQFLYMFYKDEELQNILEEETNIAPYIDTDNLCLYILEANASSPDSALNIKDAIKRYLVKREIPFTYSDKAEKDFDVFLSAVPKWLDPPADYFADILNNSALGSAAKKEQVKARIKKDFRCLKNPPKWIQNPAWPIEGGKPLVFAGQLEIDSEIFHDKGAVYVFLDTETGDIETVMQFY